MRTTQFPAVFNLRNLNGQNGFKLDGETSNDYSGNSVRAAGDINSDGHADLLIGAYCHLYSSPNCGTGRSYVVFGGPTAGSGGTIALSSLNGANGFKLDGEASLDYSGNSVSAAGDINGDGHADLLIGAYGHASNTGRSYVVFGGPTVGSGGTIALSSLNGTNGFKLDGENNDDYSGHSVSAVGDINGDGCADVVIGADGYPSGINQGRSYVVLGGTGVGQTGNLLLSSLNGANGFKLDGENNGDQSGTSVSAAGDINGDGYADLVIGAPGYPGGTSGSRWKGRSYVVFGGPGVGNSGTLLLSNLNGSNGFKLDGENNYDYSGYFVSAAGDINGDGYADMVIGAYGYLSGTVKGRSYVVFGGSGVSQNGDLLLSSLNGTNGFKLDGENSGDRSGVSVSAAGDINGDGLADLIIGANGYLAGSNRGSSYVVFGDLSPQLMINQLVIHQGQSFLLSQQNLNATDNSPSFWLNFTVSNVNHGYFALVSNPSQPVTQFTQPAVWAQQVQFVHDGKLSAPNYEVQVINPGIALSPPPQKVNVTFIQEPVLMMTPLTVHQGESVSITSQFLAVTDYYPADQVNFTISNLKYGQFNLLPSDTLILQFSEQQLLNGQISFTQDGSIHTPSYQVSVSDPYFTLPAQPGLINFNPQSITAVNCSFPGLEGYSNTDIVCTTIHNLVVGIPSAFGGVALALLGLFLRRRDIEKTWAEPRYVIHNYLRRELNLEIGRATNEARYISGIYKLLGAILGIEEQKEEKGNRRDSHYELQIGEQVTQMSAEHQIRYGQAIVSAIRDHILFPKLCCDEREAQERKGVKLKMPIYRYFNGSIPNPLSCFTTYEFRPDVLGAAFEGIVETAKSSLSGDLGLQLPLSSPKISRGRGSSGLFQDSSEAPGQIQMELTHIRPSTSFSAEGT